MKANKLTDSQKIFVAKVGEYDMLSLVDFEEKQQK